MALLESLMLMAAQATAPPPPPPARSAPPPLELLEFLADWSDEDARLIDAEDKPADKATPPKKPRERHASDAEGKTP
jgi:hypothetical protein